MLDRLKDARTGELCADTATGILDETPDNKTGDECADAIFRGLIEIAQKHEMITPNDAGKFVNLPKN